MKLPLIKRDAQRVSPTGVACFQQANAPHTHSKT